MKKNYDYESKYLQFDNLNFKLAVLQQLIFEKKVFKPEYDFGDFYEEVYNDDANYDEVIEKYAQRALFYFTNLSIPGKYAKYITEINATIDDEIYYEIYPEWTGENFFYINRISEREVSQFPKLRYITFLYMSDYVDELKKQMKPLKIKVSTARADQEKAISFWISVLLITFIVSILGILGGFLFYQKYADVEVFEGETETIISEEDHNFFEESEDASSDSEFNSYESKTNLDESIAELRKFLDEQLESSTFEKGTEN
ncbi:MAG: DUF6892 domain-containing protein [Lachnospiraceae bacterium]